MNKSLFVQVWKFAPLVTFSRSDPKVSPVDKLIQAIILHVWWVHLLFYLLCTQRHITTKHEASQVQRKGRKTQLDFILVSLSHRSVNSILTLHYLGRDGWFRCARLFTGLPSRRKNPFSLWRSNIPTKYSLPPSKKKISPRNMCVCARFGESVSSSRH